MLFAIQGCSRDQPTADVDLADIPHITATEVVRVGSRNDPDSGFSRIASLDVDSEGNVFLFESVDRQIRKYNEQGTEILRFGRSGDGPGEFQTVATVGVLGDSVWVLETGNSRRRISLFNRNGDFVSSSWAEGVNVPLSGYQIGVATPQFMGLDGFFIGHVSSIIAAPLDGPPSGIDANDVVMEPRVRFDLNGLVVDTIGWDPRVPPPEQWLEATTFRGVNYLTQPPNDAALSVRHTYGALRVERNIATDPEFGLLTVISIGLARDTVYHRTILYEPVRYNESVLNSLAVQYSGIQVTDDRRRYSAISRLTPDSSEIRKAIRSAFAFPEFQPPVQQIWLDNDQRLWIKRENTGDRLVDWIVLDADGWPGFQTSLPQTFRPMWSRDVDVWGTLPDEFEVPMLVKYRLDALR